MANSWKWSVGALILASILAQPVLAEREVYRCVYPSGLIEFRGAPVMGVDCVRVETAPMSDASSPPAFASEGGSAPIREGTAGADSQETASSSDLRAQNCEAAKRNLQLLEGEDPVATTGPDGEPVLMSDDERAVMLRQTRRDMEYWCADP